ncbi:hypothetical protein BO70DRAFT_374841 [Aspergillus heteromorphus CBS 117.55]|uniref:N-acetyltransferase domain-containing protein n=1 Tax=Aspergillus heteromorphus CBS 117.55 TaxID=1448321 RepID=A0A317UVB0_9EURO|nr:uncharacterized protein BO70DRAFT_374841 [Aspergillus heteromorphus CBS 117.55]PWY65993.1 hypothetical protein BO70DRAFT_374841 [Aspergillus heteromorphus CBS 117.55]
MPPPPPSPSPFQIRDASTNTNPSDTPFIISTFDSSLTYLSSIGSIDQWGLTPFSERGDFPTETRKEIQQSETNQRTGSNISNGLRIFIVEREYTHTHPEAGDTPPHLRLTADGKRVLPVGFAYVRENWVPGYVASQTQLAVPVPVPVPVPGTEGEGEGEGFLYLEVIVTDTRVGELRRGAGAALIRGIREYGRERGMRALWVDSWAGNGRKLVRYYEEQGFEAVGDWSHERANKSPWLGTLMRMEI